MGEGSGIAESCSVVYRHGWALELLWLWCKLATVASIQPLAQKFPYAMGVALKRQKKKKKGSLDLFLGNGLKIPGREESESFLCATCQEWTEQVHC